MDSRDAEIHCIDCGNSFIFTGAEARLFDQRGLAAPKRCKDCRRARKVAGPQGAGGGARPSRFGGDGGHGGNEGHGNYGNSGGYNQGNQGGYSPGNQAPRGRGFAAPRGPRSFTGDVNEYRSPMPDPYFGQTSAGARGPSRGPRPDARGPRPAHAGARPNHGGQQGGAPRGQDRAQPAFERKPRPDRPSFSITCSGCNTQAEVPFKPAEGRDVFCQACYRAKREG
jgi:CxxC-x17-CxxC domain-containing protein